MKPNLFLASYNSASRWHDHLTQSLARRFDVLDDRGTPTEVRRRLHRADVVLLPAAVSATTVPLAAYYLGAAIGRGVPYLIVSATPLTGSPKASQRCLVVATSKIDLFASALLREVANVEGGNMPTPKLSVVRSRALQLQIMNILTRRVTKHTKHSAHRELAMPYKLDEAFSILKQIAYAKFNETVELSVLLGVDPERADQMVRGTTVLPHGTGQTRRVVVIAQGEKQREAQEAGADYVGGDDIVERIQNGWVDYDAVIATPDMMRSVGTLGKVLGPRGLMPNPKTGTVTFDVAKAIQEIKSGKVEFHVDKTSVIHVSVGKISFSADQLMDNASAVINAVRKAKPMAAKGKYVRSIYISSTMGPSIRVDALTAENLGGRKGIA